MTESVPLGGSPYTFLTQKERDTESYLDYFIARYHSGAQGRFLSPDPESAGAIPDDPQSWNGYAYARNNPLLYVDPFGEDYRVCQENGVCTTLNDEEYRKFRKDSSLTAKRSDQGDSGLVDLYAVNEVGEEIGHYGTAQYLEVGESTPAGLESQGLGPADLLIPGSIFRKEIKTGVEVAEGGLRSFFRPGKFGSEAGFARLTGNEAARKAALLGFKKRIPPQKAHFNSHGQPVFQKGDRFITPDVDQHLGGTWKLFDRSGNRLGTYNEDLTIRLGD